MTNTVEDAVERLQTYVETYDKQPNYKDYIPRIYLNDILYGLAISMNPKCRCADGFRELKKDLAEYLKREINQSEGSTND